MARTSREISSVMTSAANNYNTRLDSSSNVQGFASKMLTMYEEEEKE